MYSWDDDTSGWSSPGSYSYSSATASERAAEAARAAAAGPRRYGRSSPDLERVDPRKKVASGSKNPLVIAVDVTGSMASWPAEIFDRLPLLFNTLSQYRPDLEVMFAAIGDITADRWPLQVTSFARGFDLEAQLGSIYGEGNGGDAPESYGLFAYWMNRQVELTGAPERPFLFVFGDAPMHARLEAGKIEQVIGRRPRGDVDAIAAFQELSTRWNAWFLRRPGGRQGDEIDAQWRRALGDSQVLQLDDESRAVDTAMALVAQAWGHFDDFKVNMRARQSDDRVSALEARLGSMGVPRELKCPKCTAPLPPGARGSFPCPFCAATIAL
jgi:hypothetical protein